MIRNQLYIYIFDSLLPEHSLNVTLAKYEIDGLRSTMFLIVFFTQ